MKNFLQNLLIFFALCLCALIAFQWVRETDLRKQVQQLSDTIHDKLEAIQNLEANVKRDAAEIQRLDGLKNQLTQTVKSNDVQIATLSRDLDKTQADLERSQKQTEVYKDAVQKANDNILKQNEEIRKANEEMKKLAEDHNALVGKFNKLAQDYKELAERWNKQQEDLQKAATNAPAKK